MLDTLKLMCTLNVSIVSRNIQPLNYYIIAPKKYFRLFTLSSLSSIVKNAQLMSTQTKDLYHTGDTVPEGLLKMYHKLQRFCLDSKLHLVVIYT